MNDICKCEYCCIEARQVISSGQFANNNLKDIIIRVIEDYERLNLKYKILEDNNDKSRS
ncbi:MAG: hypothetical protein V4471_05345 [Pseudomonadota bacterium]